MEVCDPTTRADLEAFWTLFQKRRPGQEMFPFNLHATFKTEERAEQMGQLPDRFRITHVAMKTAVTETCDPRMDSGNLK